MIYKQKALFCTYVFKRTPNPLEFRRRRSLDDVQASSRLRGTLARENFTSGSRRPAISSSMLKFPIIQTRTERRYNIKFRALDIYLNHLYLNGIST